jgi:NitT/TauT family transport system substrate-binding protein
MRVMKARDEAPDSPLVCFCEVVARDPFYLIGRSGRPGFRLADLSRVRFAAVSEVPTPWMCLQHDLRAHGLDPARVRRTADRTMAQNFAALRDHELDVIQVFEPFASMALQNGAGEILYAAAARGPTVYTAFIATRDAVERHRLALVGMIRAMRRIQRWLAQTPAEELADVTAPFFPDFPREILVSSFRRYRGAHVWARSPEMSRQGFARLAESLMSGGFVSRMPSYEECVEQTLG